MFEQLGNHEPEPESQVKAFLHEPLPIFQKGSWTAKSDNFKKYFIKFEQLEEQHGDRRYIEWTDDVRCKT